MLHYGLESDQLSLIIYTPSTEAIEAENNPTKQMINSFIWDPQGEKRFILNTVDEGRVTLLSFNFQTNDYANLTSDNNVYGLPIIISSDGNSMVIDYSSFTHATLLGVITKDGEFFKSSDFYDK